MANRIREVRITQPKWDPGSAELWISLVPDFVTPTTEMRGRLVGPRCVYSTTVEVAYPLRPLQRQAGEMPGITRRVIIPEASLWEPECPFLYEGPIELWQDGQKCDEVRVRHGLCHVQINSRGLHLNGNLLKVKGKAVTNLSEGQAVELRQAGINTLWLKDQQSAANVYELADRRGFCVISNVLGNADDLDRALILQTHPSCIGWSLTVEEMAAAMKLKPDWPSRATANGGLLGAELHSLPHHSLPKEVSLVICDERDLAVLETVALPKIVKTMRFLGEVGILKHFFIV